MLPAEHRMRRRDDFTMTTRRGRRVKAGALVMHHLPLAAHDSRLGSTTTHDGADPARVGFVVSRSVGGSVVRHAVVRRLRAQMAQTILPELPTGSRTVVRALPTAATSSSVALGNDLSRAWRSLARRV